MQGQDFFSTAEAADLLGVARWQVARLYELNLLPEPQRLAGSRLISRKEIPEIVRALQRRGWLARSQKNKSASGANGTPLVETTLAADDHHEDATPATNNEGASW